MSGAPTPPTPNTSPTDPARVRAIERLRQGQAHELAFRFVEASTTYDEAVQLLSNATRSADETAERELAIAWMNLANVRAKLGALPEAVQAYDAALSALANQPTNDVGAQATRGAAWLNRSATLQRIGTVDALAEATSSSDQALVWLARLPLTAGATPAYRINLAGAWLNRAELEMLRNQPPSAVRDAVRYALEFALPATKDEASAAAIVLKARLILLAVLAGELATPSAAETAMTTASDVIDEGLDLVRHWQARRIPPLIELGLQLFHRGAHFYATQQPHFLVEFLRETFSPSSSPQPGGAPDPWRENLRAIALESLEVAERRLHSAWLTPDGRRPLNDILATLAEVRAYRAAWASSTPSN